MPRPRSLPSPSGPPDNPPPCWNNSAFLLGQTPCQSTLHRLLGKLDAHTLAAALRTAFQRPVPHDRGAEGIAIDGKAQRGRLQYEGQRCSVHLLSAFCQEANLVLAAEPIEAGMTRSRPS